jgi:hypothetical protein
MRNENNTETKERKTESAADSDIAIFVVGVAIVSFALGFCVASALAAAQIASMLAAQ